MSEIPGGGEDVPADYREAASTKIFPRNLTARAAVLVAGNPVTSRLEDSVANCFPGLELDIRNLDRRFFPGLVFEFVDDGARLAYVDLHRDPDLHPQPEDLDGENDPRHHARTLFRKLEEREEQLAQGDWFIEWIAQGEARMRVNGYDGDTLWRFVRSLAHGPVTIGLQRRLGEGEAEDQETTVTLDGWRRRFSDSRTGVISAAYQPGELTQGLCSPWQHDFRDCACHYWAANHPDVVLAEVYPGENFTGSDVPLDWLRVQRERGREAAAGPAFALNRPYQLDHHQINSVWQQLKVVVEGRETGGLYVPPAASAEPAFASPEEMADELEYLVQLELTLVFEYLYARSSVHDEASLNNAQAATPQMLAVVAFVRERLLLIATSEMQHLRWTNQILRELYRRELVRGPDGQPRRYQPVLEPAARVPVAAGMPTLASMPASDARARKSRPQAIGRYTAAMRSASRPPPPARRDAGDTRLQQLEPLTLDVIDGFVAIEQRQGYIDRAYSRVFATLQNRLYPQDLAELASRIASDGEQHEKRFREVRQALNGVSPNAHLRDPFKEGEEDGNARSARPPLEVVKLGLHAAYVAAATGDLPKSAEAAAKSRVAMTELLEVCDKLAKKGIGVPFFKIWDAIRVP